MRITDIDYSEDPERKIDHDWAMAVGSEGGLFRHQTRHIHKSGRIFDVEVNTQYLEREGFFFSFIRDVTDLNRARKELEDRLGFEKVISEFSTALINIKADQIKKELAKWLEIFVGLIGADRCAVNEYKDDKKEIINLMQYSVSGLKVLVPGVRNIPEGEMNELERGIISAEKIPEDLPQMLKGSFIEKSGAKSLIIVPLLTDNKIFGNLAFTNHRKERKWSDELVRRIKLISEIVANAILRLRSHEALLEEMERRYILEDRHSSVIRNANVGFMISDLKANILEVNDAYCEMSGYSRDELLGMKISQLDKTFVSEKIEKHNARIFETGSFHHETSHVRKDGGVINVFISASILEKEGMVCCFIRDIADIKIAKKELEDRLLFEELISEFSAALVNVKIDNSKAELNTWFKRFSELLDLDKCAIGEYSDDYSTYRYVCTYTNPALSPKPSSFPEILYKGEDYGVERYLMNGESIKMEKPSDRLGTIRSSIYSAQKRLVGQNEKVKKSLDRAERNIKRCDLIIEELLNFSRTQDLIRKQTSLDSWIDEILAEIGSPEGIIVEKDYNSNVSVHMDQERFRQCMVNILTNAYQAIDEKGVWMSRGLFMS